MTLNRRTDPLRLIAVRLAVPELEKVAREPGIGDAYRVTVQYHDGRYPDQLSTLTFHHSGGGTAALSVHYRRANDRPLVISLRPPYERCREFAAALRVLQFDKLDDMPDVPWFGADLWMIERASGSFYHDILLSPERAHGVHGAIAALVREMLREAVRPMNT